MREVIRLEQVSLWRRTQEEFSYDLKRTIFSIIEGKYKQPSKKLVLKDVDFVVHSGERVGIIGSNGSGKSTLLKVICGILQPTSGQVRVKGKIAPLIELGAGFDPELSLKDNIVLYGVMLGFSRLEMTRKVSDILDFAELQEYILSPVKALSSGMMARLGFAVATDIQSDILILDEILSVGDERFKTKSRQRMERLWGNDATILLVSHDLDFIKKSCQRAIWLEKGVINYSGTAPDTIKYYLKSVQNNLD